MEARTNAPVAGYNNNNNEVVSRLPVVHRVGILGLRLVQSIWHLDGIGGCLLVCLRRCEAYCFPCFSKC
jgi:hypothetical protein